MRRDAISDRIPNGGFRPERARRRAARGSEKEGEEEREIEDEEEVDDIFSHLRRARATEEGFASGEGGFVRLA